VNAVKTDRPNAAMSGDMIENNTVNVEDDDDDDVVRAYDQICIHVVTRRPSPSSPSAAAAGLASDVDEVFASQTYTYTQ